MQNEKDMIEINLNTPTAPDGKETNYFSNIKFTKSEDSGFPYGYYEKNNDMTSKQQNAMKYTAFHSGAANFFSNNEMLKTSKISCLRQMYCPDCQERLDAESVHFEKLLTCCLPIFPIYYCCVNRHINRKVICNKCGCNLGYWKRS